MPNLFDYLLWRGDLPFDAVPPGEADKLLLAQLSYVFFDGFVPGLAQGGETPLAKAARAVLDQGQDGNGIHQIGYMWRDDRKLLELLAQAPRYKELMLSGYESVLTKNAQFGALTVSLSPDLACVSFRGTDDTLIGWKEDCALAFNDPVPAQRMSVEYLTRIAQTRGGRLMTVGHSKGGNLAAYACACAGKAVQDKVDAIVSCDGPGLDSGMLKTPGYRAVAPRIEKYVPQSSVIGMLLEYEDNYAVVKSDGLGLLQHSAFSWQIMGGALVRQQQPTPASKYVNHVIKAWLDDMDMEKRRQFVTALFEVLEKTDLTSVDQINARFLFNLPAALLKTRSVDPALRAQLHGELRALILTALKALARLEPAPDGAPEKKEAQAVQKADPPKSVPAPNQQG